MGTFSQAINTCSVKWTLSNVRTLALAIVFVHVITIFLIVSFEKRANCWCNRELMFAFIFSLRRHQVSRYKFTKNIITHTFLESEGNTKLMFFFNCSEILVASILKNSFKVHIIFSSIDKWVYAVAPSSI